MTSIIDGLYASVEQYPYAAFFSLPILGSIGLPLPEDAILLFLGVLASKKGIMMLPALVSVYSGILASDLLIFFAGSVFGRRIVTHKFVRRLFSTEKLAGMEKAFARTGPLIIMVGRQIFWVRAKIILVAGITNLPLRRFLLVDMAAALITVGCMVSIGYGGEKWLALLKPALHITNAAPLAVPAAAVIILCLVLVALHRQRKRGHAEHWWSRLPEQRP